MKNKLSNKSGIWGELRKKNMEKNNSQIVSIMKRNNTLYSYLDNYQSATEQRGELLLKKVRDERGIDKNLWRSDPFEYVFRDIEAQVDVKNQLEKEIRNSKI